MKKSTFAVLVITALAFLVACVKTRSVNLGETVTQQRVAVPWRDVAVYKTAAEIPRAYREIALLVSTGDSLWSNESQMWNSMKRRAGKLGANAIVLDAMSEPSSVSKVLSTVLLGVGGSRKGKALAVFVLPADKK